MHSPVPLLVLLLLTAAAASNGSQSQVRHVTSAASVFSSPILTLPPRSPAAIPAHIASRRAQSQAPGAARRGMMVPVAPAEAELGAMALALNDTRRRLGGSFQLCAPCTCCSGASGACVLAPCCYSINCNIPNRPFGYCSFTPKSCECSGCNL